MMPGEDETLSDIDDAALFAGAALDDAPGTGEQAPPAEGQGTTQPAQQQAPVQQGKAAAGDPPRQDQQEQVHRIPLAEHLAERERRQQFERELAEEKRQRADLQRQLEAMRQPQQPVDLLSDPQRFQETIEQRFERQQRELDQRMRVHSINTSFSFAERQHGEDFRKAFSALEAAAAPTMGGDTMLRDRIVNSPDPGEAVMQWYRSRQILEESGGNLGAYRERILQEQKEALLKDPAFLAEATKAARAVAAANPTIRPGTPAGLPSLTRTTSAAPINDADEDDMSDRELLSYAMGRRK